MAASPSTIVVCSHYNRSCSFMTPCCQKVYACRFCHDSKEQHTLKRSEISQVKCSNCFEVQPVSQSCMSCKIQFGAYFCSKCRLYDNKDKGQYHCDGCGLCRVGGRENFFHCNTCKLCLPIHLKNNHKCIEEASLRECPICLEDIHSSRVASHVPSCGHLLHKPCYENLFKTGYFACPICGKSMAQMEEVWKKLEEDIERLPMPEEFRNLSCRIHCKDCLKDTTSPYHHFGLKCQECGSFNTFMKSNLELPPQSSESEEL